MPVHAPMHEEPGGFGGDGGCGGGDGRLGGDGGGGLGGLGGAAEAGTPYVCPKYELTVSMSFRLNVRFQTRSSASAHEQP